MQDSSHLTIILCSSVIKIVISQKQKVNRKNNYYLLLFMFFKRIIIKLFKKNLLPVLDCVTNFFYSCFLRE
jgi:hypothetical protein